MYAKAPSEDPNTPPVFAGTSYAKWMDDFLAASQSLPGFEVHFIHFSDLFNICHGTSRDLAVDQCAAWVALFDATTGDKWKACSNARTDPCSCDGHVTCSAGKTSITGIELHGVGMAGSLPKSVSKLKSLLTFDVQGNKLSGLLPELPASLTKCTLFSSVHTNHFACPLPAKATEICKREDGDLVSASDCASAQVLFSPLVIGLVAVGGIALLVLVNLKTTKRGPFAPRRPHDGTFRSPLLEENATELSVTGDHHAGADRPAAVDITSVVVSTRNALKYSVGQHVENMGASGNICGRITHVHVDADRMSDVRAWGSSECKPGTITIQPDHEDAATARPTLQLSTSNVSKYSVGQAVLGMGSSHTSGFVVAVHADADGRAGMLTISVYETAVLKVECLSQYTVGQRLVTGEVKAIVAALTPVEQAQQADQGPGKLTVFLD